jgi:hypothetical protein
LASSAITAAGISGEMRYGQLSGPSNRRPEGVDVGSGMEGSLGPVPFPTGGLDMAVRGY